jgi:hypothetical protein
MEIDCGNLVPILSKYVHVPSIDRLLEQSAYVGAEFTSLSGRKNYSGTDFNCEQQIVSFSYLHKNYY